MNVLNFGDAEYSLKDGVLIFDLDLTTWSPRFSDILNTLSKSLLDRLNLTLGFITPKLYILLFISDFDLRVSNF